MLPRSFCSSESMGDIYLQLRALRFCFQAVSFHTTRNFGGVRSDWVLLWKANFMSIMLLVQHWSKVHLHRFAWLLRLHLWPGISFPVLHFCSTFHCIIILTVYFNAKLYWGLCSIYIWLKVFRLLPIIESDSSSQLCCLKSIQELENFEYGLFCCSLRAPWYSSEGGTLESWI